MAQKSHYAPRTEPKPIPEARWDDAPLNCLQVNGQWVSHLLGAINVLDQPDAWIGDDDAIFDARQQINEIMLSLMPQCPKFAFSRFSDSDVPPSQNPTDDGSVELGVFFFTQIYGTITHVKFYKRYDDTGAHYAHVWDKDGTMLSEELFVDETVSGWQTQALSTPVTITGYVPTQISVWFEAGLYRYDRPIFTGEIITTPFVFEEKAGLYAYGTNGTFPVNEYQWSDYYIDCVLESLRYEG